MKIENKKNKKIIDEEDIRTEYEKIMDEKETKKLTPYRWKKNKKR